MKTIFINSVVIVCSITLVGCVGDGGRAVKFSSNRPSEFTGTKQVAPPTRPDVPVTSAHEGMQTPVVPVSAPKPTPTQAPAPVQAPVSNSAPAVVSETNSASALAPSNNVSVNSGNYGRAEAVRRISAGEALQVPPQAPPPQIVYVVQGNPDAYENNSQPAPRGHRRGDHYESRGSGNYSWSSTTPYTWSGSGGSRFSGGVSASASVTVGYSDGRGNYYEPVVRGNGVVEENKNSYSSSTHTRTRVVSGQVRELGGNELAPQPPQSSFTFYDGSSGRYIYREKGGYGNTSVTYDPRSNSSTITEEVTENNTSVDERPVVYKKRWQLGDGFNSTDGAYLHDPN